MVTLEHIRQRVVGTAADMVSTLGMVAPLMHTATISGVGQEHAVRLLRKLLTRDLVLFITRLHEKSSSGRNGETASIDGLLDFAIGQLSDETVTRLKDKRTQLIADLESSGLFYKDLYAFRTTMIAHSIHRTTSAGDNTVTYSSVADIALKTYALVLEIEHELVVTGSTQFIDMPDLVEVWEARGSEFWGALHRE